MRNLLAGETEFHEFYETAEVGLGLTGGITAIALGSIGGDHGWFVANGQFAGLWVKRGQAAFWIA